MKSVTVAALFLSAAVGAAAAQEPVYKPGQQGVKSPEVVLEKKPSYTAEAMRQKIQGSIELTAIIDKDGKPTDIKVARSLDNEYGLDAKAVDALKEWRFKPATKDGKPVAIVVTVEMTFTLRDRQVYDKTFVHVKPPVLLTDTKPQYTPEAMRSRIEGTVEVEGIVGIDGKLTRVRVVKGLDAGLDAKAIEAMERCTFTPSVLDGRPVPYRVTMEFTFRLRD